MQINITPGNALSIYRQITDQIKRAIATEKIAVGDPLPSVRQLAKDLVINPNTVAKAYAELVRDGVLESQQGRGYFVAKKKASTVEANDFDVLMKQLMVSSPKRSLSIFQRMKFKSGYSLALKSFFPSQCLSEAKHDYRSSYRNSRSDEILRQ